MSNPRVRKIADRIQVIVAEMLERRIKDPRLGFVTVTDVRVTGDTQQATVFYTVYGEDDARINQALPDVERQMQAAKADFRYKIYPGTGHGFFKPGRKGSDTPALEDAWRDVLGFYGEVFGKPAR